MARFNYPKIGPEHRSWQRLRTHHCWHGATNGDECSEGTLCCPLIGPLRQILASDWLRRGQDTWTSNNRSAPEAQRRHCCQQIQTASFVRIPDNNTTIVIWTLFGRYFCPFDSFNCLSSHSYVNYLDLFTLSRFPWNLSIFLDFTKYL